jgi:hypothetical protein
MVPSSWTMHGKNNGYSDTKFYEWKHNSVIKDNSKLWKHEVIWHKLVIYRKQFTEENNWWLSNSLTSQINQSILTAILKLCNMFGIILNTNKYQYFWEFSFSATMHSAIGFLQKDYTDTHTHARNLTLGSYI